MVRNKIVKASLMAAALPALLLLVTALSSERILIEKLLTTLAMPTAMIWLMLWALGCFAWSLDHRRFAVLILAVWCGFTFITSPLTSYYFAARLEQGIVDFKVSELPEFEVIVVLGGGTTESPEGRAVVGGAGERVMLAARLFHAGKTRKLITTGESIESLRRTIAGRVERNGAEQTKDIWMALAVPEANIEMLGGRNTREEMSALAQWRKNLPEDASVGLITSAWHMPRALRLADREGLKFVPLPADFIAGRPPTHLIELLPSGGAAGKLEMVLKEYLAWLVGR
jgi:uncharacterized SAM-binding protein YcdF (DUF218 family)